MTIANRLPDSGAALLSVLDGERVVIRSRGSIDVIGFSEILLARSIGNSTRIVTCTGEFKVRHTLGFVVDRLAHLGLVRIHRNTAVNQRKVRRLKGLGRHRLEIELEEGRTLEVGRTFQRVLRDLLNAAVSTSRAPDTPDRPGRSGKRSLSEDHRAARRE